MNKITIGIGFVIVVAGLYLLPVSMNVQAQSEKVNGVARINTDYITLQDPITNNITGGSNVVFFNLTGGASYTLVRATVPIDINPGLSNVNRQNEYARQIKQWGNDNTIYNITKVIMKGDIIVNV